MSSWVDWIERDAKLTLTTDQKRCIAVLAVLHTGPYNLDVVGGWKTAFRFGASNVFVKLRCPPDIATQDSDALTSLVLRAHAHAVRVSILPAGRDVIEIRCHARDPWNAEAPSSTQQHPGLTQLAGRFDRVSEVAAAYQATWEES